MKKVLFIALLFSLACQNKETTSETPKADSAVTQAPKKKKFEMYEMSEMAALMEQMYKDNENLKERIKNGEKIGEFPSHFMKIHGAVMTDKQENDEFFKQQAARFIKTQQLIYDDPENAKKHFNDGVNACISCHQVKCTGPIERIKKLYIE
jgi:cytochrome c553